MYSTQMTSTKASAGCGECLGALETGLVVVMRSCPRTDSESSTVLDLPERSGIVQSRVGSWIWLA
jgi:hypothetical protein